MALVLAMQEGRSLYVDDTEVKIERAPAPNTLRVRVVTAYGDKVFDLTDRERTEVLPEVFLQLGLGTGSNMHKLVIEAPRQRKIWRDSLYHKQKAGA